MNNPYPVTISIENHLCKAQQAIMVRIMKAVFGDRLFISPPELKRGHIDGSIPRLPSQNFGSATHGYGGYAMTFKDDACRKGQPTAVTIKGSASLASRPGSVWSSVA